MGVAASGLVRLSRGGASFSHVFPVNGEYEIAVTLQRGRFDEAITDLRQAVALSGSSTLALGELAHALGRTGKTDEARRILRTVRGVALPFRGWMVVPFETIAPSSATRR